MSNSEYYHYAALEEPQLAEDLQRRHARREQNTRQWREFEDRNRLTEAECTAIDDKHLAQYGIGVFDNNKNN